MKLNEKGKNEVREKIVKQLKNVPEGRRVHLDKELLESLLFQSVTYNKEKNEKLKLPVWFGDFLRKIDLSEVSFEDVSWSLLVKDTWDYPEEAYMDIMDKESFDKMPDILPRLGDGSKIDYSHTNANIDLSKSFEFKKIGKTRLLFCDFNGVDLSKNDMSNLECYWCNLANTKIKLSPEMFDDNRYSSINYTNLKNIDLSKFSVDIIDLIRDKCFFDSNCDFSNTGLNVSLNLDVDGKNADRREALKENLKDLMHNLCGCYIDGKLVHTEQERRTIALDKKSEYEKMKEKLITKATYSIDQQVKGFKSR